MFKPDQPIESSKDDILGRTSFAQALGDAILSYKEKDSIVIGLFGAWGSGKTSIINMALEHIKSNPKLNSDYEKPIVVRFNPWNYSDQNQLITQFFRVFSMELKRQDYAGHGKEIGKKLQIFAEIVEPFTLIPMIGSFAKIFSDTAKSAGSAIESLSDLKSNDLDTIKADINDLLGEQNHKIIVIIDDIDRLNDTEIRQMFQLVKSLGDFKNTIYLLAFDKNVVINALKKVQEGSGSEYLEKVVQIPFEVPLISKDEVEHLLSRELNKLIKEVPKNKRDQGHWNDIYHNSGFKDFFRNIREVTRYLNTLRFSFEMVKNEVNVADFLAITAIQVFAPEVYYGIRDNKDLFTGVYSILGYGETDVIKEQDKKHCDEIISKGKDLPPEVLKDLLKKLFPKLESIYGNNNFGDEELETWRSDCRICSPEIFDIFFKLSLPQGEISQREIEAILSLGNNSESFAQALLKLNKDGRIIKFLEQLEDYVQSDTDIPKENIEPIITALIDIGDLFPEGDSGFFGTDIPLSLHRIFYNLSFRFESYDERFRIFKHAIEKSTRSLYTIVYEIDQQELQYAKYGSKATAAPDEELTVNSEQLEELKKLACDKIQIWAKDGRLEKHKHLAYILLKWYKGGKQEEEVNSFVKEMIKNDDGLIDFIIDFLMWVPPHNSSDSEEKSHWRIDESIKNFVDLKEIEPRVREIFNSPDFAQLEDQKKFAIETFLNSIDGKIQDSSYGGDLSLKVLYITNLFPLPFNPEIGIFITNRLKAFKSFNIDFEVYGTISTDTFGSRVFRKITGSEDRESLGAYYEVEAIRYNYISFKRRFMDIFFENVFGKNNLLKFSKELSKNLYNSIEDQRFDIIHAHGMYEPPAGLVAKLLSQKLSIPYVVTAHGSDINLAMPKAKELYVDVLENAARVIFVSNALLNKAKSFGYTGENSVVIPNGIEPDIFKPFDKEKIKKELGLSKKVVGFVGGLKKVKRADKLPEIFSYISSIYDAEFLVVGDGELRKGIENESKKRKLQVKFVGSVSHEDVPYYMNAMDVMILPSRNEGWPCVVLEAQGCGVAVVGSSNGGIPEAIGDGGIVVEDGEDFEKRFAQSVVKLLENPIDGSYLRKRALGFSWRNIVEKEIEVYNEVLNKFGGSNA